MLKTGLPKGTIASGQFCVFYFSVPITEVLEQKEEFWPVNPSGLQLFSNIVFSLYCEN